MSKGRSRRGTFARARIRDTHPARHHFNLMVHRACPAGTLVTEVYEAVMPIDLGPIKMALAACASDELFAVIDATNNAPQLAPGLLAWLEAACDWEWHRRTGRNYELQPPEAAIPPEEDAVSIDCAIALRAAF